MDEQNQNPYGTQDPNTPRDPYAMNNNAQDPYGTNDIQNPYGTNGTQSPYGTNSAQSPYGANSTQSPYGTNSTQSPYGTNSTQSPYGTNGTQSPYGTNSTQNPYGSNSAQSPYGTNGTQSPYETNSAQSPYGTNSSQSQYDAAARGPYGTNGVQSPYGTAPAANPYGTSGAGYGQPPKPPKKKMSKKAKVLIFSGIGLAVAAVAAYFLCVYVFFPAKKVVKEAMENMTAGDKLFEQSLLASEFGLDDIAKSFGSEGGEVIADLTVTGGTNDTGKSMDLKADVAIDKAGKQLSGDLELKSDDTELIDAEVFADENQTYLTVEDLMTGYLVLNNKNVLSSLKNSPLIKDDKVKQALSMIPDFDLNLFSGNNLGLTDGLFSDDNKLWKDSKVSREGSETLYAGDISVSAKKYSVTIPKETIQEMISEAVDKSLESITSTGITANIPGLSGIDPAQYSVQIKALAKNLFKDDLVYYVYIKDDKVVGIKANINIALMTYTIGAELNYTSISADSQTITRLKADINLMGQSITFDLGINTKDEGGAYKTQATMSASVLGRDIMSASYDQSYTKADQTFQGSGSFSLSNSKTLNLTVNGKVAEKEKGKMLKLHFDEVALTAEQGKGSLRVSGDVTLKTKSAGIEIKPVDSGKTSVSLATGTQDQLEKLIDSTSEGYKKFMERIKKLTGGQPIPDFTEITTEEDF
ncbi:MAG: hypothetical protein IKQ49_10140 [Eubacterium sp.]|nr:hypothetical protein [Eubacterium sp.]